MIRVRVILLLIIAVVAAGHELSAEPEGKLLGVDPQLIEKALEGKDLIFRRRYDEAYRLFSRLVKDYPDSPTGLAGMMAVWQVKMFEHDDFRYKKEFTAAEKEYEHFATKQLRDGNVVAWDLFIYGATDGMRGFFRTREGEWLGALKNALHAMRMLKKLKWLEPDFADIHLGFGAYLYWRSVVTREISILPFFADRRQEGIDLLKKVAASGRYVRDLALANLVFIYGNEERYDEAINLADQLLASYPENIIMRYRKGLINIWARRFDKALAVFEEVYRMDPTIYKALMYQGLALARMKKYAEAQGALNGYLELDTDKEGRAIAYYWLGFIAEASGDKKRAIQCYESSLMEYKLKAVRKRLRELNAVSP